MAVGGLSFAPSLGKGATCTLFYLAQQTMEGSLNPSPPFQRGPTWTTAQKVAWIESLLDRIQIPAIFINETPGVAEAYVIDGRQRLQATAEFVADKFKVRGQLWSDQPKTFQRQFRTGVLTPLVVTQHADMKDSIRLYLRLLTTGTAHTEDEIRKAERMLDHVNDS